MHQEYNYYFPHAGNLMTAATMHFDNDPSPACRMDVRFLRPVQPGEIIWTDIWIKSDGKSAFQSTSVERNVTVLSNGYF
jgi:acyl-CoA thioesterase FadM